MSRHGISGYRTESVRRVITLLLIAAACSDSKAAPTPVEPSPRITHSVSVTAPRTQIVAGETLTLQAQALDQDGQPIVGRTITWVSGNNARATVTPSGLVTAIAAGTVAISGTADGKTGTVTLVIAPARAVVATVNVGPTAIVMEVGQSRQLTAIVTDAGGNVLTDRTVEWRSLDPTASISNSGMITALAPGYATFIAISEGVQGTSVATISPRAALDFDLLYTKESGTNTNELYLLEMSSAPQPVRINAGTTSRQPVASPDGRRIAFAVSQAELGTDEEIHDIFAVDRNGFNMQRLTSSSDFEDSPAWSPDGRHIAYHSISTTGASLRSDIWVMNADGSNKTKLTGDLPQMGMVASPKWSPDGTRIAYVTSQTTADGTRNSICIMNADGGDKRAITSTLAGFDAMPSWSPDGQRIVFVRYFNGEGDLAIVNIATGTVTRIRLPGLEMSPAWSPDGTVIAFTTQLGVQSVIYTVRPNGTDLFLRTTERAWGDAWFPSWVNRP